MEVTAVQLISQLCSKYRYETLSPDQMHTLGLILQVKCYSPCSSLSMRKLSEQLFQNVLFAPPKKHRIMRSPGTDMCYVWACAGTCETEREHICAYIQVPPSLSPSLIKQLTKFQEIYYDHYAIKSTPTTKFFIFYSAAGAISYMVLKLQTVIDLKKIITQIEVMFCRM